MATRINLVEPPVLTDAHTQSDHNPGTHMGRDQLEEVLFSKSACSQINGTLPYMMK